MTPQTPSSHPWPHLGHSKTFLLSGQMGIVDVSRHHGSYLFCDESNRLLEHASEARLRPMAELYNLAVSTASLTRTCGLPGGPASWHRPSRRHFRPHSSAAVDRFLTASHAELRRGAATRGIFPPYTESWVS